MSSERWSVDQWSKITVNQLNVAQRLLPLACGIERKGALWEYEPFKIVFFLCMIINRINQLSFNSNSIREKKNLKHRTCFQWEKIRFHFAELHVLQFMNQLLIQSDTCEMWVISLFLRCYLKLRIESKNSSLHATVCSFAVKS